MGRIAELQCAAWLESNGWEIVALEATRVGPDIEALRGGNSFAFEVKAIGAQEEAFLSVLQSLLGQPSGRWTSPDAAANYLLFRTYECGKQLMSHPDSRIAILAIDEVCWHEFELQLNEGWIDWRDPTFLGEDPDWEGFLTKQHARHPQLINELADVLRSLHEIWVFKRSSSFEYHRMMSIPPRTATTPHPTLEPAASLQRARRTSGSR